MANIVTNPRPWKKKTVLFKLETNYGADVTPTGAANWIEARNLSITPAETEKVDRGIVLPYYGNSGSLVTATWTKMSFDVALVGSGTAGTPPKWGALVLACSMAETAVAGTSVTYNLVSDALKSATSYINISKVLHKALGMRGELKCKIAAKEVPLLSFEFTALYAAPDDVQLPTVVRTGWLVEKPVSSTNTAPIIINGTNLSFSTLEWALGNKITTVNLPGPFLEVQINDRAPTASVTVVAVDHATFNPFALRDSGDVVTITQEHDQGAGRKCRCELKAKVIGVDYDQINDMTAWKLTLEPTPVNGDDEIALILT